MPESPRLLLFDIDGTLVDTGGAGLASLLEATREIFGDDGPALDLAGATDTGLLKNIYRTFAREEEEATTARFFDCYLARLEVNLQDPCFGGRALDGVATLLQEIEAAQVTKGLLTGNITAGAEIKMRHYGFEGLFPFGAFGDDHHDRNELGPIALQRAGENAGQTFEPAQTLVIGDTPKDIWCAQALGARSICVATGAFTADQLRDHGADLVFEDFSETEAVLQALLPS
ncbi:HAD family hydrolase [Roseibacillus ishigakijimensis]|uniref:phosphoglycolate phosphatase n=1 Tax=Roseibacillus ishigakijimensis TaxID=454146 RepID=A0A934RNN5_9BACT|nr:HAD family hydrolase [Roseibacillus ishigakijimensis]MBK1834719.1 HAD family hydrolase [Roseibacillus ishigakijimensis]